MRDSAVPGISGTSTRSWRSARRKGLSLAAFVTEGTRLVKVRLLSNGHVIARVIRNVDANNVLTIALPTSPKSRRSLKRGVYTIEVTPGRRAG